jgi:hypothetical protein
VIGRPVPIESGAIFESAPLVVSEGAARRVARDPLCWIDVVTDEWQRPLAEDEAGFSTHVGDFGLVTDLPFLVRVMIAQPVAPKNESAGFERSDDPVALHREEQVALVMAAMHGRLGEVEDALDLDPWPAVAAALLDPLVYLGLVERLTSGDAAAVSALADRLAEPGPQVCGRLAAALTRAA